MNIKSAKIQCNRVIAEVKKFHWTEFCKSEVLESKDMYKVWKKVKEMKNGYKLQTYPIKLENNDFASESNKRMHTSDIPASVHQGSKHNILR